MDDKLKEAIAAVRTGNKREAQQQLTMLLDENPEQVQGWYLLSLLVDSPQKQAAYLGKTLDLDPTHEKAKEQLALLQAAGTLGATTVTTAQPMDVLAQAESDSLPEWLVDDPGTQTTAVPAKVPSGEAAFPNETLPDWLQEPATLDSADTTAVSEEVSVVGKTAESPIQGQPAIAVKSVSGTAKRTPPQNTRGLNILLGLLVTLAVTVIILLAYLLLT